MENLSHSHSHSHSFSRKSYGGNGFGTATHPKSVYDDVFRGGPPKFGMPTLAPRLEDYTEIFGGFHSARGSSIPILDLPVVDEAELSFDVRSSRFDYSEVLGGFHGLDFTASFEDLVRKSNGGNDPSDDEDDAWSPAQSESLSDESDPSACSERSQSSINAHTQHAFSGTRQFDVSYHKASQGCNKSMSNVEMHVAQLHDIPGHACMIDENHASKKIDGLKLQASSDLKSYMDCGGRTMKEKQFKQSISLLERCDLAMCENDFYNAEKFSGSGLSQNEPFVAVNDVNLRTKPSCLPPPSRPPPVFAVKKGVSDKMNPTLKACRSYAFDETEDDSSPPFYDVEIDGSSCMMASATMRDATKKAQSMIRSAKESIEKKEVSQSCSKLQPQNDIEIVEEKMSKTFDSINSCEDGRLHGKSAKEGIPMKFLAEERNKEIKMNQEVAALVEGECYIDLAEKPTKRRYGKESRLSHNVPNKSEGTFAWRQATEYFEVVEADIPFNAVEQNMDEDMEVQMGSAEYQCWVATEASEQQESVKEFKLAKEAPELEGKKNKVELPADPCGHKIGSEKTRESNCQTELQKKAQVGVDSCESEMGKNEKKMAKQHEEIKKLQNINDKNAESLTRIEFHAAEFKAENDPRGFSERTDTDKTFMDSHARNTNERTCRQNFGMGECHTTSNKAVEQDGNRKREMKQDEKKKKHKECCEKQKEVCERKEDQNTVKEFNVHEDNEKLLKGSIQHEESENNIKMSFEKAENERVQEQDFQIEKDEGRLTEACKLVDNEKNFKVTILKDHEERQSDACEPGKGEVRVKEDGMQECDKNLSAATQEDVEESSRMTNASAKSMNVIDKAGKHEKLSGHAKGMEQIMRDGNDGTVKLDQVTHLPMERENVKAFGGTGKPTDEMYDTLLPGKLNKKFQKLETIQAPVSHGEDENFITEVKDSEQRLNVKAANLLVEERSHLFEKSQNEVQHRRHENGTLDVTNSPCLGEYRIDYNEAGIGIQNSSVQDIEVSQRAYDPETTTLKAHEQGQRVKTSNGVQITVNKDICMDKFKLFQPCMEWAANGKVIATALSAVVEDRENTLNVAKRCSRNVERKEKNLNEGLAQEDNVIEEKLHKERELEEHLRKIEEEREREREREKDRMAVDRANLEARDRSFAEARERAERAAIERAMAEVRQRPMMEAQEKLEKAPLEARERSLADKASVEAKLRAERAAVERATLEARQRAFEKAMVDKASIEARERVERSVSDKFSASSRTFDMRQSSSFSDLPDRQSQSTGTSNKLRYSYSSAHAEVEGESPQRCKARLERYRRTAERAAKALAEKNMRDLLTQREQAERSRLAETLDAEVKRWSSGKEGNLRALLSTLQYILGPYSGWQPIPLTEVITSAAVKKAYRKATLCVHPDKLQQRAASIQQKYICEKVFDLLKEAWNAFNSEEW